MQNTLFARLFATFVLIAALSAPAIAQPVTLPSVTVGRATAITPASALTYYQGLGLTSQVRTSNPDPEIVDLARALNNNPDLIYDWVRNNAEIELTFGLSKGARGVAIDKSGTAFDQAHLMVELLRASNYTAKYVFGTITLTGQQFTDWTGISNATAATQILGNGGIPATVSATGATINSVTLMHVWVKATIGGTDYVFDPSYKPYTFTSGIDLGTAMGFNGSTFTTNALSGAVADTTPGYPRLRNLNETNIANDLTTYAQTLLTYLKTNLPNARMDNVIGGQHISPYYGAAIRQTVLPYTSTTSATFDNDIPNSLRTTLRIRGGGTLDVTYYADEIYGKMLTLERSGTSNIVLKQDGIVTTTVGNGTFLTETPAPKITFDIGHPYAASSGGYMDSQLIQTAFIKNGPVVIFAGWGDVSADLSARLAQKIGPGTSVIKSVRNKCWYVAGVLECNEPLSQSVATNDATGVRAATGWLSQFSRMTEVYARMSGSVVQHHHTVGVVSAIWTTYNTDASLIKTSLKMNLESGVSLESKTNDAAKRQATVTAVVSAANALEGSMVNQTTGGGSRVSVADKLDWVNRESLATDTDWVYYADSTNWTSIKAQLLTDYKQQKIAEAQAEAYINAGYAVVIPRSGDLGPGLQSVVVNQGPPVLSTPGPERGAALIAIKPDDSSLAYVVVRDSATEKGGGGSVETSQTKFFSPEQSFLKDVNDSRNLGSGGDVQTGDLSYTAPVDLTVGSGDFPYSLTFQRSYQAGLGWTHTYSSSAEKTGSGLLASGVLSPREAAEMLVAFHAQLYLAPTSQSTGLDKLKRHVTAAMVNKWWADKLELNQLLLTVGPSGYAFTKLADGTWQPSQGDATQLTVNSPAAPSNGTCAATPTYILTFKDQSKANFAVCKSIDGNSTATLVQSITFPYGMSVNVSYEFTNLTVSQISNTVGRTIQLYTVGANTLVTTEGSTPGNPRIVTLLNGSFCSPVAATCESSFSGATNPLGQTTTYTYTTPSSAYPTSQYLTEVRVPSNPNAAFVSYSYDSRLRLKTVTDAAGRVWNYLSANGRRGGITDPLGASAFTIYDDEGNPTRSVDALGRTTAYEYDVHRRVTKATAPELNRSEIAYDARHNATNVTEYPKPGSTLQPRTTLATYDATFNVPLTVTDAMGRTTTFAYNATTGRVLTVTRHPVGGQSPVTTLTYNARGQTLTVTDPTGLVTQMAYNATNGNMESIVLDPGTPPHVASTTAISYDAMGNPTSITDPNGNVLTATYDALRRTTQVSGALGALVKRTYNVDGLLTKVEAATGNAQNPWAASDLTYDIAHRLIASTDPDGRISRFEYDAVGRRTVTIAPDLRRTRNVFDAAGQLDRVIHAENTPKQQTYLTATYSANGRVLTKKDARANITTSVFDGFDRLSSRTYTDATYEQFSYDANDNLVSKLTRAGQLITQSFDTQDRTATKIVPQAGGAPAVQTTYAYDLAGRMTQVSDTNGHAIGYSFDTAKRVSAVSQAGPGIPSARTISYQYDAAGNRTRLTWPDSYYVTYTYDALSRLATATENGTFVLASYTYDPLSRRTGTALGNGTNVAATYTGASDLLTLANNFTGSSVTFTNTFTPRHTLATQTVSNAAWEFMPATFETTSYATANTLNQYTQITKGSNPTTTLSYDAAGNLTGDGTWTFAFDAENKMTAANKSGTAATYAYDPLLRREGKSVNGVTTTFLLDGAEEISDYDGSGGMLRRYVPSDATDAPIAMVEGSGGSTVRNWFHRDRLGSTVAMSGGNGTLSEGPVAYDAFGNSASTGGVPFKYTGRRYDAETGLYYYRARYYAPALGRYLQTDPVGTCDNMNLYAYADNDPVNATDPSGMTEIEIPATTHTEQVTVWGQRPDDSHVASFWTRGIGLTHADGGGGGGSDSAPKEDKRECGPGEDASDGCTEKVTVTGKRKPKPVRAGIPTPRDLLNMLPDPKPGDRSVENCTLYCVKKDPYTTDLVESYLYIAGAYAVISGFDKLDEAIIKKWGPPLVRRGAAIVAGRYPPLFAILTGAVAGAVAVCTAKCTQGGPGP